MAEADNTLPEATPLRPPLDGAGTTRRPTVPLRKHEDLSPSTIARDFKNLDDAVGDLPLRFIRAARGLAERLDCREEWETVETAHGALRAHEG